MTLKEYLESHPIIDKAQLAKAMWPDKRSQKSRLTNKLNGNGGQRILQKDVDLAKSVLSKLFKDADRIEV